MIRRTARPQRAKTWSAHYISYLKTSDFVPLLPLNFTQDQSGNLKFCCTDLGSLNETLIVQWESHLGCPGLYIYIIYVKQSTLPSISEMNRNFFDCSESLKSFSQISSCCTFSDSSNVHHSSLFNLSLFTSLHLSWGLIRTSTSKILIIFVTWFPPGSPFLLSRTS